jgi:hypothetical protein
MKHLLSHSLLAGALAAALLGAAPRTARAYDVEGVAVGADVALAGPTGVALSVGLGRLELDFIAGLALMLPEGGVLTPGFSGAAGIFFTLADGEYTNFQLGGRVGTIIQTDGSSGTLVDQAALTLEAIIRVEHRFDDHFAINLQAGFGVQIWPDDPDFGTGQADFVFGFGGSGLVGGAGFRYWFDGLGGGAPVPAPQPIAAQPAPAPAPAATTTTTTTEQSGSGTPYWEQ